MPLRSSTLHSLRRVFNEGFAVHDIAEPLVSFDDSSSAIEVGQWMDEHHFEVIGVRRHGLVAGYLRRDALGTGTCGDVLQPFTADLVVVDSAPLTALISGLQAHTRLFVSVFGRVNGIASRSDLQKPPVRMWLFGMITLIEMRLSRLIEGQCPDGSWQAFLSEARLAKARELLEQRRRLNQDLSLLDCLQFADKGQVLARNKQLRELTRFQSRRQVEETVKMLQRLRDNLAHAQDIVTTDWETIVTLSANLDTLLEDPPEPGGRTGLTTSG